MENELKEEVPDNIVQIARELGCIKVPKYIYKDGNYDKFPAACIGGSKATKFRSMESANANKVELGDGWVAFRSPSHSGKVIKGTGNSSSSSNVSALVGGFDGADGLWKSLDEHREYIYSSKHQNAWDAILKSCFSFANKELHVFSRRDGFTCIISGLKVLELKYESGDLVIKFFKNIHNKGKRSIGQEKMKFNVNQFDISTLTKNVEEHLEEQLKTLSYLRDTNSIGYMEKWLHTTLTYHLQKNKIQGLDLDVLYYEVPVGKLKRNKRFGREKADIFARDSSGSLVIIEVKESSFNIHEAIEQGLSYVRWVDTHKDQLKERVDELGWDVNLESLKLYIIAPGNHLDQMDIKDKLKSDLNKYAISIILINDDWYSKRVIEVNKVVYIN
ncbi:hypothetical protein [Methanosalsum natronophilum]|uniref:DUF91 domain-containing protein n=1 Tax=Methanosalsum natronophilum TaxID=768733 RepID=A0A3R7X7G7_9EURY|nr:hypothetical protein [Methanosalsum natronophilum]MCS3923907.1 hypothetical protein [Methanosalsum natronophilum]RQD88868.1 MAG: hypothetical protein D5R95_02675 [Methanosalsum natronophilum]